MDKYFTEKEKVALLIELVKSLNIGNSCHYTDRVSMAEEQLQQLEWAIERLQVEK